MDKREVSDAELYGLAALVFSEAVGVQAAIAEYGDRHVREAPSNAHQALEKALAIRGLLEG